MELGCIRSETNYNIVADPPHSCQCQHGAEMQDRLIHQRIQCEGTKFHWKTMTDLAKGCEFTPVELLKVRTEILST